MGLFQNAVETYDAMDSLVGVPSEGKAVLAPIGHITTKAKIEITIDQNGQFVQTRGGETDILLPVTERSSGRTSAPVAHPLCDQLGYVLDIDKNKNALYVQELSKWANSSFGHPYVEAVLSYVKSGKCRSDLEKSGMIKIDEKTGRVENEKDFVCWRIVDEAGENNAVWESRSLMEAYIRYTEELNAGSEKDIDLISGELTPITSQHLKGVVPLHGNAKVISANDTVNFTYRGRFLNAEEAATVGYESSQKAHNALKWLIANQGVKVGGRIFVCWNPRGREIPPVTKSLLRRRESRIEPSDYKSELSKELMGYANKLGSADKAILAAFDAATTGRLSISYYNELAASDFLDRLKLWDETCCWYDNRWGVSSPSLHEIVNQALGLFRSGRWEVDDKIYGPGMQRMLVCRIDKAMFPLDIMRALMQKAGNLQILDTTPRNQLLFTTCAVIRKYRWDHRSEEWSMALEKNREDRSYQFGRLLAVLEKIERDTYAADEKRETNAIRMQSVYIKRPGYTFGIIQEQLKRAYYQQLNPGSRSFYEKLIGEIVSMIASFGVEEYDKPLDETYLLGYYLQKNELYKKREVVETEDA